MVIEYPSYTVIVTK